jgi:hypothetical protein
MSVDVDLYTFDWDELVQVLTGLGADDPKLLEAILLEFGFKFDNTYIILCDETAEYCNSYYSLGTVIDDMFNIEDSFSEIVDRSTLLEAHNSVEDVEEKLGKLYAKK